MGATEIWRSILSALAKALSGTWNARWLVRYVVLTILLPVLSPAATKLVAFSMLSFGAQKGLLESLSSPWYRVNYGLSLLLRPAVFLRYATGSVFLTSEATRLVLGAGNLLPRW